MPREWLILLDFVPAYELWKLRKKNILYPRVTVRRRPARFEVYACKRVHPRLRDATSSHGPPDLRLVDALVQESRVLIGRPVLFCDVQ